MNYSTFTHLEQLVSQSLPWFLIPGNSDFFVSLPFIFMFQYSSPSPNVGYLKAINSVQLVGETAVGKTKALSNCSHC
jgi:hypothetical protein